MMPEQLNTGIAQRKREILHSVITTVTLCDVHCSDSALIREDHIRFSDGAM